MTAATKLLLTAPLQTPAGAPDTSANAQGELEILKHKSEGWEGALHLGLHVCQLQLWQLSSHTSNLGPCCLEHKQGHQQTLLT